MCGGEFPQGMAQGTLGAQAEAAARSHKIR